MIALAVLPGCNTTGTSQPSAELAVASLNVIGQQSPLNVGSTAQLTATAVLSDGSTRVVTTFASWSSTNQASATVSPSGLVTAVAVGDAEIRAAYRGSSGAQGVSVIATGSGLSCGVERWAVKTLSDVNAAQVNLNAVRPVSIKNLNLEPAHCSGLPNARTFAQEFVLYEITGRITVARAEDDHDYHIALADPADPSYTIVTEVADPNCNGAIQSAFRGLIMKANADLTALIAGRSIGSIVGSTVRVRGVGFYDFNHGQTGRSQSCMELHPLTSVERVQ